MYLYIYISIYILYAYVSIYIHIYSLLYRKEKDQRGIGISHVALGTLLSFRISEMFLVLAVPWLLHTAKLFSIGISWSVGRLQAPDRARIRACMNERVCVAAMSADVCMRIRHNTAESYL